MAGIVETVDKIIALCVRKIRKLGDDDLVSSKEFQEYALKQNFIRSKYLGIGVIILFIAIFYNVLSHNKEYEYAYILSFIFLGLLSVINIFLVTFFKEWFLTHSVWGQSIVIFFWCSFIFLDFPSFLVDAAQTYQPLNLTTWLAAMGFFLILTRKQVCYVYPAFLLLNLVIAFYADSPVFYVSDVISRVVITASVAYFLIYPYHIAVVKNIVNSRLDPLTGLMNRREGRKRVEFLLETNKRIKRHTAFYMLDLDNFKKYNDTYGHQKGDEAILFVVKCIKKTFTRGEDINVRYGGEEFLICASVESKEVAEAMAQTLHKNIRCSSSDPI